MDGFTEAEERLGHIPTVVVESGRRQRRGALLFLDFSGLANAIQHDMARMVVDRSEPQKSRTTRGWCGSCCWYSSEPILQVDATFLDRRGSSRFRESISRRPRAFEQLRELQQTYRLSQYRGTDP